MSDKEEVKVEKTEKTEAPRRQTPASMPQPAAEAEKEHLIYIGPTLPGGLEQHALFTDGIPARVAKRFEDTPELRELFIAVEDFPAGRVDIETPGTELYAALEAVKKGVV